MEEKPIALARSKELRKEIRASHFFTWGFGCIIGVAWVVVLGDLINRAGPLGTIIGFTAGGLVTILIGVCYAEIGTMYPFSGGEVAYAYEIYGVKTCFAAGWFLALAYISITAFEAVSVGWIVDTLIPGIKGTVIYTSRGYQVHLGSLTLGLGGMFVIAFLNYVGVKAAANFQRFLTYLKTALALLFIAMGIMWGNAANLEPLVRRGGSGSMWGGVLTVFLTAPFWYSGFNVINQVIEEKTERTSLKVIGKIIVLSIVAAMIFYCLVILACSMLMPWEQLSTLDLPVASVFEAALHKPWLTKMVLFAALLGNLTAWNGVFIAASRVIFALGRAHIIRPGFGRIHPVFGSPSAAVVFVGLVSTLGVFLGRGIISPIVNLSSTCFAILFVLICLGTIKMRWLRPDEYRPCRVPGGGKTAVGAVLGSLFMLFVSFYQPYVDASGRFPLEWGLFLAWAMLGGLFWIVASKSRRSVAEVDRRKVISKAGHEP